MQQLVRHKEHAHNWVEAIQRVWDFDFESFGQRQSRFGGWLLSCDRIALDCYQVVYLGWARLSPFPAPPPFTYMRTGFSPATFRRIIPLRRLGGSSTRFRDPVALSPDRQSLDTGRGAARGQPQLAERAGRPRPCPARSSSGCWTRACRGCSCHLARGNREAYADLSALLLGGPAVVASLMDVIGRGPQMVLTYSPEGPVPNTLSTRTSSSIELLRRMGFEEEAERYRRLWTRLYPDPRRGTAIRCWAPSREANCLFVDAVCYQPFAALGDKSLAQVIQYGAKEQHMAEEAARRLAAGTDPGIIPARFLSGSARIALDRHLASPGSYHQSLLSRVVEEIVAWRWMLCFGTWPCS